MLARLKPTITPEKARELIREQIEALWRNAKAEATTLPRPRYCGLENVSQEPMTAMGRRGEVINGRPMYDVTSVDGSVTRVYGNVDWTQKNDVFFVDRNGTRVTNLFGIKAPEPA